LVGKEILVGGGGLEADECIIELNCFVPAFFISRVQGELQSQNVFEGEKRNGR